MFGWPLGIVRSTPTEFYNLQKSVSESYFLSCDKHNGTHVRPEPSAGIGRHRNDTLEVLTREDRHCICVAALGDGNPHQFESIRAATDRTQTPVSMHASQVDS